MLTDAPSSPAGRLLREWRVRRRLSQLDLATAAGISARHLSFVETGRARPSREMVLHLADHLDVPLRERNPLLIAAGYAPTYTQSDLGAPEMLAVREAIERLLDAHEPYPAILVDRRWNLVSANAAAALLVEGVHADLLAPPLNVLRVTLHPDGLATRITNLPQWVDHLLGGLRRQIALTGDDELVALESELAGYAASMGVDTDARLETPRAVAIPLRLRGLHGGDGELAFVTMIATFGTALDITLEELAIETFLPADAPTAGALRARQAAAAAAR
jgi:transcriptional regulator with XRE-family HTH domain